MALKLAGEESSVVSGLDDAGWLREIKASDSSPALTLNQSGSGLHLKVGLGTPGRNPAVYLAGKLEVDDSAYFDNGIVLAGGMELDMNSGNILNCGQLRGRDNANLIIRANCYTTAAEVKDMQLDTLSPAVNNWLSRIVVRGGDGTQEVDIQNAHLDLNGNLIKGAKMVLQCLKKTVNYNDPSPVTVFSALANTAIVDVLVEIATAFVGTSPTLDIGDGSDADGFLPNAESSPTTAGWKGEEADTKGVYLWDATDKHTLKKVYGAATNVIATIGGSGLTAGVANVYVYYLEMA